MYKETEREIHIAKTLMEHRIRENFKTLKEAGWRLHKLSEKNNLPYDHYCTRILNMTHLLEFEARHGMPNDVLEAMQLALCNWINRLGEDILAIVKEDIVEDDPEPPRAA